MMAPGIPNQESAPMLWYDDPDNTSDPFDEDLYDDMHESHQEPNLILDRRHQNKVTTKDGVFDLTHAQRCLGWKPLDVVEKTLQATTQMAQNHVRLPLKMHFKSRSPALNIRRLREPQRTT